MAILDPTDTPEERKKKLHDMDKELHPDKHRFDKEFYSVQDWQNMCYTCGTHIKHLFVPDVACNGFRRKK